ncbi:MAG: NAD(P)-dependent oxidoreductase [archaeon]
MKRVIVTGASGFIGRKILEAFAGRYELYGTYFGSAAPNLDFLDIRDKTAVLEYFSKIKPAIVIHCAAVPNVNYCETNPDLCRQVNVDGTINVVEASKLNSSKMVFMSTDYIFDGKDGPYSEESKPNPLNNYGRMKIDCEQHITAKLSDYLIIRTTNVFGWGQNSKNFAMFLISKLKAGEKVYVAEDQYGNPTLVDNLAQAILELVDRGKQGVYNIVGPENLNRYEFSLRIAKAFNLNARLVVPRKTEQLAQPAPRPKHSGFITDKASRELKTKLLNTDAGLSVMKRQMDVK